MKIALVTNSKAGSGKALKMARKIHVLLQQKNIVSTLFTENEWDDRVYDHTQAWIIGGDGTVNFFVNRYSDIKIPLSIFKGGTGNDFHALLYGNKSLVEQIELALTSSAKPIDAGKCNDRYFLNGVGIGFEGAVAKSLMGVNKLPGKTSFLLSILKHIYFYKEQIYKIKTAEKDIEGKFLMLSVANGTRYGGGFYVAPLAKPDDGWLDANFVKPLSALKRLKYLPVIEKGKHLKLPFIDYFKTQKVIISSKQPVQAHLDGEYLEAYEMTIKILPNHFNIIY